MEILFLDSSPSSHHQRFVELFSTLGNVHSVYVDFQQKAPALEFGLVVFADLDVTVDYAREFSVPRVGLSWAWDLQMTLRRGPDVEVKLIRAIKLVDILIVDSAVVEKIAEGFGIPRSKIVRVPYGIDLENYPLRKFKKSNSENLRLFTNRRWEEIYRPQLLLEMARELSNSEMKFELFIANDGSLRESLINEYSRLFENGSCIWLGKISQSQNIMELEKADIYLSVAKSDGSSLSLLEAMAIGTPALVTDHPANREWVDENITGYLFSGSLGIDLAKKILSLNLDFISNSQLPKLSHNRILRDANWTLIREILLSRVQGILHI